MAIGFKVPTRWGDQLKSKFLPCRMMEKAALIIPVAIVALHYQVHCPRKCTVYRKVDIPPYMLYQTVSNPYHIYCL